MSVRNFAPQMSTATALTDREPSRSAMLFVSAPERKSRLPGLGASVLIHAVLFTALCACFSDEPPSTVAMVHRRYSIRLVQLQMPRRSRRVSNDLTQPAAAKLQAPKKPSASPSRIGHGTSLAASKPTTAIEQSQAKVRPPFKLPANIRVQPVKQTLVQMDLPPNIRLKQDTAIPTMLLWTQPTAPPMRKRYIVPPVKKVVPKLPETLPVSPAVEIPNREVNPAELNIASAAITETPALVHPPTVASPVSRIGQEPAKEIPQVGVVHSDQPNPVNLISLPGNLPPASTLLVLPPANQVAPDDAGASGSRPGSGESGAAGRNSSDSGAGTPAPSVAGGSPAGSNDANGELARNTGSGTSGGMASSADGGSWSASGAAGTVGEGSVPPGFTRLTLPKDGNFSVVVLGSANSAAYPESVGALSGKVIYTVYLKIGLRKSWILQYCLPSNGNERSVSRRSGTPLKAPWPYLIMRPDQWSASDPDYIILHGMLTQEGKFDQLAMVFPDELDKKELLMSSLKLWAFRPASRDGVPVAVEVLLTIPREAD